MATVDIFSPSVRKESSAVDRMRAHLQEFTARPSPSTDFTDEDMATIRRNRAAAMQNRREANSVIVDEVAGVSSSPSSEQMLRTWLNSTPTWQVMGDAVPAPIMTEQEEREMEEDLANMSLDMSQDVDYPEDEPDFDAHGIEPEVW